MTRTLRATLVTLGNPATMTGGYLFHRRLADLAATEDAQLSFASFPERPFPLAVIDAPRVMREAERQRADVLVLDSIAAAFLAPWLSIRPRVPVVGMLHQPPGGIDHGPVRQWLQARLDRLAYRRADRLLAASDDLAAELQREHVHPRIFVVPPGRDVADEAVAAADLRHGRSIALLCVGNWVARKGILDLLEAVARLPDPLATLHLVGDDTAEPAYAERVRRRIERPDLRARVVVHGRKSINEVAGLYAAANVFVLPSMREPYGTVYGEAMAFGLPVVGWRAGNLPHLAEHEQQGLILEPGDIAGLAAALARLADDADLRQRLGASARERALARPTWRAVASIFFDHLREVVSRTSTPPARFGRGAHQ